MTELEMFTKLPRLNKDYEVSLENAYTPTLSPLINEQYIVCWLDKRTCKVLDVYFCTDTPEEAIRNAYKWCKENNIV